MSGDGLFGPNNPVLTTIVCDLQVKSPPASLLGSPVGKEKAITGKKRVSLLKQPCLENQIQMKKLKLEEKQEVDDEEPALTED